MSTQGISAHSSNQNLLTTKDTKEHQGEQSEERKLLLDEPWRVKILPPEPKLPPGVLPAPQAYQRKSLPWRMGEVARLKDDSPEGMMRYIAAHTDGWWREMAERALRDTEKAKRMAEEAGVQPGQYWSLEVDIEQKQKLLELEEAKRVREEEQRAKELAEKEAFTRRQMELLEKAGRAPRCEYVYTDGLGCRAPQVKGERWCHGHARMMSYRPEKLEMLPLEDENAVMVNLYRVTTSLLAGRITEKAAGLMLWSVAIGATRLPQRITRKNTNHPGVTRGKSFVSEDGRRGTPGRKKRQSGENSLRPHGDELHPRDLSLRASRSPRAKDPGLPPKKPLPRSESLKMTRGRGLRKTGEHRKARIQKCIDGSTRPSSPALRDRSGIAHHDKMRSSFSSRRAIPGSRGIASESEIKSHRRVAVARRSEGHRSQTSPTRRGAGRALAPLTPRPSTRLIKIGGL